MALASEYFVNLSPTMDDSESRPMIASVGGSSIRHSDARLGCGACITIAFTRNTSSGFQRERRR